MPSNKKKIDATIKKLGALWRRICVSLCKIHLVDKCLLMIMLVLLSQSAYILLTNGGNNTEANHIDIIVRTAAASIFGYFLSANFVQRSTTPKSDTMELKRPTELNEKSTGQIEASQKRIGFVLGEGSLELEQGNVASAPQLDDEKTFEIGRFQILTATAIAMFCLIALILVRDVAGYGSTANESTTAVVSQFRDFVSGCVGFLIGCPTSKSASK